MLRVSLHTEGVDWNILKKANFFIALVSLHTEGVDWNKSSYIKDVEAERLPPHGGSGLKWLIIILLNSNRSLPPHGGSGLKYISGRPIVYESSLPPHGGSGLKLLQGHEVQSRRTVSLHTEGVDWNGAKKILDAYGKVSLHTEGVDWNKKCVICVRDV